MKIVVEVALRRISDCTLGASAVAIVASDIWSGFTVHVVGHSLASSD